MTLNRRILKKKKNLVVLCPLSNFREIDFKDYIKGIALYNEIVFYFTYVLGHKYDI